MSHREKMIRHADRRAVQRFGIHLSKADNARLAAEIEAGKWLRQNTLSGGRVRFAVLLPNKKPASVVYDQSKRVIVTVFDVHGSCGR